jgi:hypothetical protein
MYLYDSCDSCNKHWSFPYRPLLIQLILILKKLWYSWNWSWPTVQLPCVTALRFKKSKSRYDRRSVSQYVVVSSSLWNPWPDIILSEIAVLSPWGALSNERSGLKSQSQSHVTTDNQSVSMSWCQVHSGTRHKILYSVWKLMCCLCGAPSLTRGRVCLLSVTFNSV